MATQQARWAKVNLGDTDEYGEIIETVESSWRPFIVRLVDGSSHPFATIHAVDDATVTVLEQREALIRLANAQAALVLALRLTDRPDLIIEAEEAAAAALRRIIELGVNL